MLWYCVVFISFCELIFRFILIICGIFFFSWYFLRRVILHCVGRRAFLVFWVDINSICPEMFWGRWCTFTNYMYKSECFIFYWSSCYFRVKGCPYYNLIAFQYFLLSSDVVCIYCGFLDSNNKNYCNLHIYIFLSL